MIDVKPTTLEYEAVIKCYKTSQVRRTGGGAFVNRELVTLGSAAKIGGRGMRKNSIYLLVQFVLINRAKSLLSLVAM
uniref:Uncharacterized protein n=1 Tax=Globodera rostochiensis TaxID=31243 RepID=A0A914HW05_GLORO